MMGWCVLIALFVAVAASHSLSDLKQDGPLFCISLIDHIDRSWCENSCNNLPPYCPEDRCQCSLDPLFPTQAIAAPPAEPKQCVAIMAPATDSWCTSGCNALPAHCPSMYCSCDGDAADSDRLSCYSLRRPATNDWCENSCNHEPAYCPSNFCTCGERPEPEENGAWYSSCDTYTNEQCTALCNSGDPNLCYHGCCSREDPFGWFPSPSEAAEAAQMRAEMTMGVVEGSGLPIIVSGMFDSTPLVILSVEFELEESDIGWFTNPSCPSYSATWCRDQCATSGLEACGAGDCCSPYPSYQSSVVFYVLGASVDDFPVSSQDILIDAIADLVPGVVSSQVTMTTSDETDSLRIEATMRLFTPFTLDIDDDVDTDEDVEDKILSGW